MLWKNLSIKWKLYSGLDIRIENRGDWETYNEVFVDEEYDIPIKKVADSISKNSRLNILDLGSNVGFFSLRVADLILKKQNPPDFHITLVEGSPNVYKDLVSRLSDNELLKGKVSLINGLIGLKKGKGEIFEHGFHPMNSVFKKDRSGKQFLVDFIDLTSLNCVKSEIDLLKCDIEGSEITFLKNYQDDFLPKVKNIVIEFHHKYCDVADGIAILNKLGFNNNMKLKIKQDFSTYYFWK